MFKKLLKHDFRALKRIGIPMLFVLLGSTVIASVYMGIAFGTNAFDENFGLLGVLFTILMACSIMAIVAYPIVMQFMVYMDFYKSLMTDEGYLTFTLPVKAKDIIFSKSTNGVIWTAISGAAAIVCGLIVIFTGMIASGAFSEPSVETNEETVGLAAAAVTAILGIILAIVWFLLTQLIYFILIFVGSSMFKNRKPSNIVWLIIAYSFASNVVLSVVSFIVSIIGTAIGVAVDSAFVTTTVTLGLFIVLAAGALIGAFFLLKHLMEKKLNLP